MGDSYGTQECWRWKIGNDCANDTWSFQEIEACTNSNAPNGAKYTAQELYYVSEPFNGYHGLCLFSTDTEVKL